MNQFKLIKSLTSDYEADKTIASIAFINHALVACQTFPKEQRNKILAVVDDVIKGRKIFYNFIHIGKFIEELLLR